MKLELDREDLMPEFENVNTSQVRFEHFKPEVQRAIQEVGQATFWDWDRRNHNAVYPPSPNLDKETDK